MGPQRVATPQSNCKGRSLVRERVARHLRDQSPTTGFPETRSSPAFDGPAPWPWRWSISTKRDRQHQDSASVTVSFARVPDALAWLLPRSQNLRASDKVGYPVSCLRRKGGDRYNFEIR